MDLIKGSLENADFTVGVVTAEWNSEITFRLESGALEELKKIGVGNIVAVRVPGAFEIPLAAKSLLDHGCKAIVALGCVIRGETSHYDFVCNAVERGCSQLQLDYGRPVAFGVLTTENEDQAMARAGGAHGNKGAEAARVAVEMVNLLEQIEHVQE